MELMCIGGIYEGGRNKRNVLDGTGVVESFISVPIQRVSPFHSEGESPFLCDFWGDLSSLDNNVKFID